MRMCVAFLNPQHNRYHTTGTSVDVLVCAGKYKIMETEELGKMKQKMGIWEWMMFDRGYCVCLSNRSLNEQLR